VLPTAEHAHTLVLAVGEPRSGSVRGLHERHAGPAADRLCPLRSDAPRDLGTCHEEVNRRVVKYKIR
jgi:hypothetical protein